MSKVSGVTLLVSCSDEDTGNELALSLGLRGGVEEHYGGTKHPQQMIYGAGINYADEDEIAARVGATTWEYKSNVVLVIDPEQGSTRVWRFVNGEWGEVGATKEVYGGIISTRLQISRDAERNRR